MLQDHFEGIAYRENSSCAWLIQPATPTNITLYFTRLALTANSNDSLMIYDGSSATDQNLIKPYVATSELPQPLTATSGALFVTFQTSILPPDLSPLTGFQAYYFANDPSCGASCGSNGYCIAGSTKCVCFSGYTEPDCTQAPQPSQAQLLNTSQVVIDSLRTLEWAFYGVVVPELYQVIIELSPSAAVSSSSSSTASSTNTSNLQLYVQFGSLPVPSSGLSFLTTADTTTNMYKYVSMTQPSNGTWYVAVQNLDSQLLTTYYQLNLTYVCFCQNGGVCSASTNYQCSCPSGYTGLQCQDQVSGGISAVALAFIIIIICMALSVLIIIGFLVYLRYNIIKGYFLNYFAETDPPSSNENDYDFGPHNLD